MAGPPALSRGRGCSASLRRLRRGESGPFRSIRRDRTACRGTLPGGGVHGRARAGGDLGDAARRSPSGCGAGQGNESVWRSASASPGRRSSPRWRAGPPNRTACSSSIRIGRRTFLRPLPVEALWGVGLVTANKLRAHGVGTIGELERRDEWELALFLGAHAARHLHAIAQRRDPRRVRRGPPRRSIGTQSAFAGGGRSGSDLDALLVSLVDRVTRRARAANRAGRTVTLRFRFADFSRATRSRTLAHPTAGTGAILAAARTLLAAARPMIERRGITLLGITVANLSHEAQLELPLDPRVDPALDLAIDEIRKRFGTDAIRRGSTAPSTPRHVSQV